jgi:hypothetical protein
MGHQLDAHVGTRLLEMFRAQYASGFCSPVSLCFQECTHGGKDIDVQRPHQMILPQQGKLAVSFVDLTPVRVDIAMHPAIFVALRSILIHQKVWCRALHMHHSFTQIRTCPTGEGDRLLAA